LLLAAVFSGVLECPANAAVYTFDFDNLAAGFEATGTLTTDAPVGQTGNVVSVIGGVTGLGAGTIVFAPTGGITVIDPAFTYNDILYAGSNPKFDVQGRYLRIQRLGQFDNYSFYNTAPIGTQNALTAGDGPSQVSVLITAVPEPSTWAMMILGLCGLGFMAYRRKQNGTAFSAA
jgi:hypothetical protein